MWETAGDLKPDAGTAALTHKTNAEQTEWNNQPACLRSGRSLHLRSGLRRTPPRSLVLEKGKNIVTRRVPLNPCQQLEASPSRRGKQWPAHTSAALHSGMSLRLPARGSGAGQARATRRARDTAAVSIAGRGQRN